ncbi:MAG: copper-binding protein [Burkholderiales bacterium]|nr:copper-binding protein [Burkholderiales bacterium]
MKRFITYTFIFASAWAAPYALASADHASHEAAQTVAQAAPLSAGEIKKVDKALGKLTIKHGPLENLGMPAMTMIFRVKDAATLDQVKPGDRIRFLAEKVDGVITVTKLEVVTP